ncbi:MAG: phosphoenolpyruvate--protein phosphotransferase [Lachnospiraceae bacterium]|nr:phosphoenolpyruvate--protein phosphotransferase [Lachnospiraceae bacterium]
MYTIEGKCGCEGVAIGPAFIIDTEKKEFSFKENVDPRDEIRKFWNAKEKAKEQISKLLHKSNTASSSIGSSIFSAYIMYLDDIGLKKDVENLIVNDNFSAKQAIKAVGERYYNYVVSMENNPRIQARAIDVEELIDRLLLCMDGEELGVAEPDEPSIVVAKDLTPSWFFSVNRDKVLGFVLESGAYNSHFAILARSFDIPLLIDSKDVMSKVKSGQECALYSSVDKFVIEPTDERLAEIQQAIEEDAIEKERIEEYKGRETLTHGGERIILYANVSSLEEIDIALKNDAEGIGLFRTEYIYMQSEDYPTEEDQYRIYKEAIRKVDGKIIVFRTADIGGDKLPSYVEAPPSMNSPMGNRGIRFSMQYRQVFKTQLRALYRAAYYGIGNVNIMYPMVTKIEEIDWIDEVREEVEQELKHEHVNYSVPEHGIVLETPAAAVIADIFAKRVDFISIGTNDLSQFLFALDRMDHNIDIEDFQGEVMRRIIERIIKVGEKEGVPIGLCGDIASNKETLKWLIDAGIKGLSIQPRQILLFRKYIREM